MKRIAILGLLCAVGCAYAPEQPQAADQVQEAEHLMRDGARATMTSRQNSFLAASCYATAFNNRGDGLTANAARTDAADHWRVTVREHNGRAVAIVNVGPAGATSTGPTDTSGSASELFLRQRFGRGGVDNLRRFLAERC
jgi:hypothetical protein